MEEITAMTRSSELCFNKDDFTAVDFSVDKFVSEYRKHTSLETIKEDLGLFLKVLQSAMVELINKDYADFVNLSTNLVGLDKSIKNLSAPLKEFQMQITGVLSKLEDALSFLSKGLQKRESIHGKKVLLHRIMRVFEGIENIEKQNMKSIKDSSNPEVLPPDVIERIAVEYSQIKFHMFQNSSAYIIQEKQIIVNKISECLLQHLEALFLSSLTNSNAENMHRVLRVYTTIDQVQEVENIFRVKIVRPYMREVITENFIAKNGIDAMYNCVLELIPQKCNMLLEMTRGRKKDFEVVKGYDFLVNSVWPEIVLCLEYITAVIFAPGNPSLFHKNYTTSVLFVEKFEQLCVVQTSVKRLRDHPSYNCFVAKWNLMVYFEIRFQEIGGLLEIALMSPFSQEKDRDRYLLNASFALWQGINWCWDSGVYVQTLCHKFWKLTLQLLSRYCYWVKTLLKTEENYHEESLSNDAEKSDVVSVMQLVALVQDIESLTFDVYAFYEETITKYLGTGSSITKDALQECLDHYRTLPELIGKLIVKRLTTSCTQHLKLIMDIPRLYRKTNREVPSKPSSYISIVLSPLSTFLSETESLRLPEWKAMWTSDVINSIIGQCITMTADVLMSVKKMEDSLKRLKKAREKPVGQPTLGAMSDDDKIRRQLVIDVEHLGKQIESYGINKSIANYRKLEDLVVSASKTGSAL